MQNRKKYCCDKGEIMQEYYKKWTELNERKGNKIPTAW